MPLITLGDSSKLQLKVPSKGDTGWESDFKTEFAQKIVDHDHTGADGKGIKITTAAIEDNAITTAKLGTDVVLSSLNNVASTAPSSGQVLKWAGSEWAPSADLSASTVITIANQTDATNYTSTPGDTVVITAGVSFPTGTISDCSIFTNTSADVTFHDLKRCNITGGILNSAIIVNSGIEACNITTRSHLKLNNHSSTFYIHSSDINCTNLYFNVDNSGQLHFVRNDIYCGAIFKLGSVGGTDKIRFGSGNTIEASSFTIDPTFADVTIGDGTLLKIRNSFKGKLYHGNRSTIILERSTSTPLELPFKIQESLLIIDVPVAGRYNISSDVTVDTSSSDTLNVNWDTVKQQSGGLSLSGGRVVIPYTGFYAMNAGIYVDNVDNSADNASIRWRIFVEGNSQVYSEKAQISNSGDHIQDSQSMIFYCQEGDLIGVFVQEVSDGDNSILVKSTPTVTFLTVHLIK